ncbi:MAG: PQQ-binding-like beta-propeller repeat protein [Chloroflexota bacterium]
MDERTRKMSNPRRRLPLPSIAIALFVLFMVWGGLRNWQNKPPVYVRTLIGGTGDPDVQAIYKFSHSSGDTGAVNPSGVYYSYDSIKDFLFAFETRSGTYLWQRKPPLKQGGGVGAIIVSQSTLYVTTALGVYACNAATGDVIWSSVLGEGHVSVVSQLEQERSILRIYYGDTIFEIDPITGEILRSWPKGDLLWLEDQIEIYPATPAGLEGRDQTTGEVIWENRERAFLVDDKLTPMQINPTTLLVKSEMRNYCTLDLSGGAYLWCSLDRFRANSAIHYEKMAGYALRDDFTLVEFDLQTGATLSETQFAPTKLSPNDNRGYSYFIAVTPDGEVLIFFGDSGELLVVKPNGA